MVSIRDDWYNQRLEDGGPVYMETTPGQFIVEPWNAASSLLMIIPALYWIYRIRKNPGHDTILWLVVILVLTGAAGSALFHGLRTSLFFLLLDVLPSAILTLTLCIYLWIRVLRKWWIIFLVIIPVFGIRFIIWGRLPENAAINLSYLITGISIGLPLILFLFKTRFKNWSLVVVSILSFGIALIFRQTDPVPIKLLPMGTHFLWHTFSALGSYFIMDYLYTITRIRPN